MAWFNSGYAYKKKITLDHTKVSGGSNLTSFPVLISRTDADLKSVGNGGKVQNSSGFDIIFTDSTEATKLDHEIEQYVASTGEIEMWVRIPTLSASVDTVIYMYCSNSGISTSQENVTGVWDSNFGAVWHLKESAGTSNSIKDSTTNANAGTPYTNFNGTTVGDLSTTGQIAKGQAFNGTTGLTTISVPNSTSININGINTLTISAWVKRASSGATGVIVSHGQGGVGGYEMAIGVSPATANQIKATRFGVADVTAGTFPADTNWHHVVEVGNSSGTTIYIDGASSGTDAGNSNWPSYTGSFYIGSHDGANNDSYFNGSIDEVRLSNIARSAGWIGTEYANQNSPSTFHTVDGLVPLQGNKTQGNGKFARVG